MKPGRGSTLFLKAVIVFVAIGSLIALIWFPQTEGRATNLNLVDIYTDPFILYVYAVSIAYFVALYQAFKLLRYTEQDRAFSQPAVNALRTIKYCALILIVAIIAAMAYIRIGSGDDDPAGALVIGAFVTLAFVVIAAGAAVLERLLQNAVDLKTENDLTV